MNVWEFGLIFTAIGIACVLGALRRWKWLIDPPTFLWFCYSQALVKVVAGTEGCRVFTLVLGQVFIGVGLFMLSQPLLGGVHGP